MGHYAAASIVRTDYDTLKQKFYEASGITPPPQDVAQSCNALLFHYFNVLNDNLGSHYAETIATRFKPIKRGDASEPVSSTYIMARLRGNINIQNDLEFALQFAKAIRPEIDKAITDKWLDTQGNPRPAEDILREAYSEAVIPAELKGKAALLHFTARCNDISGLPKYAVGPIIGKDPMWLARMTPDSEATLQSYDVICVANRLRPYMDGQKKWEAMLDITDPEWRRINLKARDFFVNALKQSLKKNAPKFLPEVDTELSKEPAPQTLGATVTRLREAVHLTQGMFEDVLPQVIVSYLENDCFSPHMLDAKGELKNAVTEKLKPLAEEMAEYWPTRSETPDTKVTSARAVQTPSRGKYLRDMYE